MSGHRWPLLVLSLANAIPGIIQELSRLSRVLFGTWQRSLIIAEPVFEISL